MLEPTKKDWKLYREKIAEWQEDYMQRLVEEYSKLLAEDSPASTKFWELEKRIKKDRRSPGVCVELKRSAMIWDIVSLISDGIINFEALEDFSDELKEIIRHLSRM